MTELQFGLIGLGVVGVVVYNIWQEYKLRKLAQKVLDVQHADVLLGAAHDDKSEEASAGWPAGGRSSPAASGDEAPLDLLRREPAVAEPLAPSYAEQREPGLRSEPEFAAPRAVPQPATPKPTAQPTAQPAPAAAAVPAAAPTPATPRAAEDARESVVEPLYLLSPVIDYVASFEAVEPASAHQILEAQSRALARIRKPLHWIGYNERTRDWEPVIDDGESEFRRLRVGLQLVDRKGPLANGELSTFCRAMQDLADELMAIAELPPRQPALDAAQKLEAFCASVDIQIGINVVSDGQSFAGTKLRALAEAAGMVIDGEGRFVRCDDDGVVQYVLVNQEAPGFLVDAMKTMTTRGVTFLLDVPRVPHGERVFNQMVDLARRFADVLCGSLVDDNRRPLSEGALEPIRRQVGQYQAMMSAQSLPAGGPLAQRLFS